MHIEIGNNRLIPSVISFKLKIDLSYFATSVQADGWHGDRTIFTLSFDSFGQYRGRVIKFHGIMFRVTLLENYICWNKTLKMPFTSDSKASPLCNCDPVSDQWTRSSFSNILLFPQEFMLLYWSKFFYFVIFMLLMCTLGQWWQRVLWHTTISLIQIILFHK